TLLWGRALWYLDERSPALRRGIFFVMARTRRPPGEVRALLLSASYYGLGLLAALLLCAVFRLSLPALLSISPLHLWLVVLGIVGEISLTNLLVGIGCAVTRQGRPEQFAEIREIPWMKG